MRNWIGIGETWRRARRVVVAPLVVVGLLAGAGIAQAQLRIVSYNTMEQAHADLAIVFTAIGENTRNGIAKPIDVLSLQEQFTMSTTTQNIVNILNSIYGEGTYARSAVNGGTSGGGRPGLIYNTNTVELLAESAIGAVNVNAQARQTLRYQLKPVGYDDSAIFYLYSSHYKSDTGTANQERRNIEATAIRNNSDALGDGTHAIYSGDLNLYTSSEPAFQTLLSDGAGQAFDPVDRIGSWSNSFNFRDVHTQSPCAGSGCPGVGGGLDDRFDFQLVTGEFLDGEGLSYIGPTVPGMSGLEHSYHPFGNNGSTFDTNINAASNTVTFPGVTSYTKSQILNALWTVTDHLPVVADYQVPAVLEALVGSYPSTLTVGQEYNLELTVRNAADVVASIGADELDYSVTTAFGGDVSGSFFNQVDLALGAGNTHLLPFDTSTPGLKTGTVFVQSGSPMVANNELEFEINFEVVAAMPELFGDYNGDDIVDAADYTVWRDSLGLEIMLPGEDPSVTPGMVTQEDYDVWRLHFGQTLPGSGSAATAAVPEPGTWTLLVLGGCLTLSRRGRLMRWTRPM